MPYPQNPLPRLLLLLLLTLSLTHCTPPTQVDGVQEKCSDGIDNDENGAIDCNDPACAAFPTCNGVEHCYNGIDDDGDGLIDCDDDACDGSFLCLQDIEDCANGRDDDSDGRIDCDDSACQRTSVCSPGAEACTSDIDEDGDGRIGCEDDDCKNVFACLATFELASNQVDDDNDDLTDCEDPDIARTADCLDGGEACDDGIDNDGDGLTDCADVDCSQTRECLLSAEVCNNGIDDNGNGLTDCDDPRCEYTGFCGKEICLDGSGDEDGDGMFNCADPDCLYATTCLDDFIPPDPCTRDARGVPDCTDVDCQLEVECQITMQEEVCDDGIDNDGDGLTDCEDASDCVIPFVDRDDHTCIVELCGDESGVVRSRNLSDRESVTITSDDDMRREFPAQGGPTLLRGTLSFANSIPGALRFLISPSHSLRCILPNNEGFGLLNITNSSLQDFSGLANLRVVQGIRIELWDAFPGFAGLTQLLHVLGIIEIDAARGVMAKPRTPFSFQGFDALKTLGEVVYLKLIELGPNDGEVATRVFDFDGLGELVEVRGNLITLQDSADQVDPCRIVPGGDPEQGLRDWHVQGNFFQVDSFAGLESLRRIGGSVCAAPTSTFQDFGGLEQLERIDGDFMIGLPDGPEEASPASLIDFNGLQGLVDIGGSFAVQRDRFMTDSTMCIFEVPNYNGLQGLQTVGEHMSLCMSTGFDGFDAFASLQRIEGDLYLTATPGDTLSSPSAPFTAFTSLTGIAGTLLLQHTAIDSLDGLESLTELGGLELFNNTQLTSIQALSNITALGSGNLWIEDSNALLTSASGLENIQTVQGNLILIGRREFLDAMQSIERVEGKLYLSRLFNVTDLTSLSTLTYIGGLGLDTLPQLQTLAGIPSQRAYSSNVLLARLSDPDLGILNNLEEIGGYLAVEEVNASLPFTSLQRVGGNMTIRAMPSLSDLAVLNNLVAVEGSITLDNNAVMISLTGLENLTQVTNLTVRDNPALLDLGGLSGVMAIGAISVENNTTLTELNFSSLTTINSNVLIRNNEQLNQIEGIHRDVMRFAGENVTIQDNVSLDCAQIAQLINTYDMNRANMSISINFTIANNLTTMCP